MVIHNHPYYVSLIAALGTLPELVHQTGSLFLDDMYLVENYDGEIDAPWRAAELAQQIGSANLVILANHGVIATGRNLAEAVYRAVSIERVCRLAYDVMVTGRTPSKMNRGDMVGMRAVADRTRRRRVLGRRGPDDHQGRPQRSDLELITDTRTRICTMTSIDEMSADLNFTTAKTGADRTVTFLPEPERAERRYTVISVDDHIVEPPDTFEGRVPRKFADRAPRWSTPTTAVRPGCTTGSHCPTSASTRSSDDRCPSTASSPPGSTKCGAAHGISTSASRTWTSTACTRR